MCNLIKVPINEQLYNIMSSKNAVFFLYCRQSMDFLICLTLSVVVSADTNKESCKDMLQGYLTGQLSSAPGAYQIEALRREFQSFSIEVKKALKEVKEKQVADMQLIQGRIQIQDEIMYYNSFFNLVIFY